MHIQSIERVSTSIKYYIEEDGTEVARASIFLIQNDLHEEPYGFLEDVFVHEDYRKQGYGSKIVKHTIEEAKKLGCYKFCCNSEYEKERLHEWYKGMGFEDNGRFFRMNF